MSLTYLKGSRTKTKNNLLLVLEQGQAITDDGAKSTQLSMVITTYWPQQPNGSTRH